MKNGNKTILEYILDKEDLELEATCLDPKVYYKVQEESTILDEYFDEEPVEAEGDDNKLLNTDDVEEGEGEISNN